ncbi:hypothetical protein FB567DRAFT_607963 [Paraphoma chrysanthemicola]|uniref:Fungal N-terminal domain-containing protein n=1 Tax=Paraphoma chrysanthemicola TaxID=798071 RepID=A0A8K0QXB1_9PLEO|nr:hypothetical protein FB567DRAFT_607963 [Paraphoma chrysanthemicola]
MEVFGVVAGVASLSELLLKGFKTLRKLQHDLNEAKDEVERLVRAMQRLKNVMDEVETLGICHGTDDESLWTRSSLTTHWDEHSSSMKADLLGLVAKLDDLHVAFEKPSKTRNNVRPRFRKVFAEHDIERYERILQDHRAGFSFMLSVLAERRQRSIVSELKVQSKYLQMIAANSSTAHTSQTIIIANTTNIQKISSTSQTLQLGSSIHKMVANKFDEIPCKSIEDRHTKEIVQSAVTHTNALIETGPEIDGLSNFYAASRRPQITGLPTDKTLAKHGIYCRVFTYNVPLGTFSARKVTTRKLWRGQSRETSSWHLEMVFYPLELLSKVVFRLNLEWGPSVAFRFGAKLHAFNSSPELKRHLNMGNISAILRMFEEGYAHPTDLIAPSGNTLLHEAAMRHGLGVPNMLELCRVLLDASVDPNMMNLRKRTPLMQCCQIMQEGDEINRRMLPMTTLLLEYHADLSFRDDSGESACLLIFQSGCGLEYMQNILYRLISLDVYQSFQSKDLWLVSSIARTMPTFRQRLEGELRDLRTPTGLSSSIRPRYEKILELDAEKQKDWIAHAPPPDRVSFMKALCSYGTPEMVQPFIESSIDLNEVSGPSDKLYTRYAARMGNLGVLIALVNAGASLEQEEWLWRSNNLCASALEELLERWAFISAGMTVQGKEAPSVEKESWILDWLLKQPGHKSSNALYCVMLKNQNHPAVFDKILKAGYGRRDGQAPASNHVKYTGSEVVEAVKTQNSCLKTFLDAGLALECEDWRGLSAVIYAIDMGATEDLKLLIEAGANVERRCGFGVTPLELASSNLRAGHPRKRNRGLVYPWGLKDESFELETDREIYSILVKALEKNGKTELLD